MTATYLLVQGNSRHIPLPDQSVQCVVTSPPYFGLRDYGTASWAGGNPQCNHKVENKHQVQGASSQRQGRSNTEDQRNENFRSICGRCGAIRADRQIGLEPTPQAYIESLLQVFAEVWRILKDDGTLWLVLGDSYANDGKWGGHTGGKHAAALHASPIGRNKRYTGLKPKDLIGVPWRCAFALQDAGWWLRQEVIWEKPNGMTESVVDRPTTSHERLFLLAKAERYYFDAPAVREPDSGQDHARRVLSGQPSLEPSGGLNGAHKGIRTTKGRDGLGRNIRSVWRIPSEPSRYAHYATYPRKLVEPCIKAGTRPGDLVFDPFAGTGTTGVVAQALGRRFIGLELNPKYCRMAARRINRPHASVIRERTEEDLPLFRDKPNGAPSNSSQSPR